MAINDVRVEGMTLQQANKLIQEASDVIDLEVMYNVNDAIVPTSGTFEVTMKRTSTVTLGITINGRCGGDLFSPPFSLSKLHLHIICEYMHTYKMYNTCISVFLYVLECNIPIIYTSHLLYFYRDPS